MEQEPLKEFPLELFEMRDQKPLKTYGYFINFYNDHLHYFIECTCMEPVDKSDKSLGEEKVLSSFEKKILRSHCFGVEKEYVQKSKSNKNPTNFWYITIFHLEGACTKIFYSEDKKEKAEELYKFAYDWISGKDIQKFPGT